MLFNVKRRYDADGISSMRYFEIIFNHTFNSQEREIMKLFIHFRAPDSFR